MKPGDRLDDWLGFAEAVRARLDYGDRSFPSYPAALLDEVAEELLDVCGWCYVLWSRLRAIREGAYCTLAFNSSQDLGFHSTGQPLRLRDLLGRHELGDRVPSLQVVGIL